MHRYLESVRSDIEKKSGEDSYLSSSLFLRIYKEIQYEDEGKRILKTKKEFEAIRDQSINAIMQSKNWNLKDEILSWQVAVLRDITKEFYTRWDDYIETKFMASDVLENGNTGTALEASCEVFGVNPEEVYTVISEVRHLLTRLCVSSNFILQELSKYWVFKHRILGSHEENEFAQKRVKSESINTIMSDCIERLKEITTYCMIFPKHFSGSRYLLWMNAINELNSLNTSLSAFLECKYHEQTELILNEWVENIFPTNLLDGSVNPLKNSSFHLQVVRKMTQATNFLVEYVCKKRDSFKERDMVMHPFLKESLNSVMIQHIQENEVEEVKQALK